MFLYIETVNMHAVCIFTKKMEVPNALYMNQSALSSGVHAGFDGRIEKEDLKLDVIF